jgi:hypothetical protein
LFDTLACYIHEVGENEGVYFVPDRPNESLTQEQISILDLAWRRQEYLWSEDGPRGGSIPTESDEWVEGPGGIRIRYEKVTGITNGAVLSATMRTIK